MLAPLSPPLLDRDMSNHVPPLLSSRIEPPHCNTIRYENYWVEREGFQDVARKSWHAPSYCRHDVDKWQKKDKGN